MGKMKDKFIKEQERLVNEAVEAFMDDDYHLEEYYASIEPVDCSGNCEECECDSKPVIMEEQQANYNAWWNSLTEEQKQQLYIEQEEAFKQDKS